MFERSKSSDRAGRRAVTLEHHTTNACVVVSYLIVFALVNGRLLGEGGANLPLCTEYAEFMHLKLIT